jgi:hypothetical protein
MKVQCDVCTAEAASVFCCADEAALCDACDRRVHRANKLAGKHRRFSLLHPCSSSSSSAAHKPPLCDICQVLAVSVSSLIELGLGRCFGAC